MKDYDKLLLLHGRSKYSNFKKFPRGWDATWEGMKDSYDWFDFRDYLSPLRRYLEKQVGRHWDDVYSELSKRVKGRRTLRGWHLDEHIWMEVDTQAKLEAWYGVYTWRYWWGQLYIDYDGYLRKAPDQGPERRRKRLARKYEKAPCKALKPRPLTPYQEEEAWDFNVKFHTNDYLKKIDGIWYFMKYKTRPCIERYFGSERVRYGTEGYWKKLQLNKKELKRWNLKNDNSFCRPLHPVQRVRRED